MPELMQDDLYGTVSAFGLEEEQGIMIESLNFDGATEKIEHKNGRGHVQGCRIYNRTITWTMSGAVPLTGAASLKLGATLVLANELPDFWAKAPTETSVVIEGIKKNSSNTEAQKLELTGTIYPFGKTVVPTADVLDSY